MSNVTLGGANPTVLVFENGVTLGGTINWGTGGSTLDVLGGAFNVNTGSTMAIVAPTTAPTSYHVGILHSSWRRPHAARDKQD